MSFANLKRNSNASLEKLSKAAENINKSYNSDEDEYWKCEVDKAGNGFAIIRFLPAPMVDGEDGIPWVKYYDHGFQGPGGWYIEKSLTSIGQNDPASEYNSELWNTGLEANKQIARDQKRRLHYVSNIYIIKDSKNPHFEGKVKKFKYGSKIFEKHQSAMNPQFEGDVAFDPFNFWTGANFKLKIRKVDGYQNYDLSTFDTPGPLFEDDALLEEIWKSEYSLASIIDPKNFKSYDELKARLNKVLAITSPTISRESTAKAVAQQKIETKEKEVESAFSESKETDSADSDLDFFASILDDD
jgi:hypothetical protein